MEVRILDSGDADAWWRLRLEALQTETFAFGKSVEEHLAAPAETIAHRFENPSPAKFNLGAFANGDLLGMATFMRETGFRERHKGWIYAVYVSPALRGRGAGRALIARLIEYAQQDPSLEQILLGVASTQHTAITLYESFGFRRFGTEPHALKIGSHYVDEHHMILMV